MIRHLGLAYVSSNQRVGALSLEGERFASMVNEMTEQVRKLGPFNRNGGGKAS